jgi:hypothetical protein
MQLARAHCCPVWQMRVSSLCAPEFLVKVSCCTQQEAKQEEMEIQKRAACFFSWPEPNAPAINTAQGRLCQSQAVVFAKSHGPRDGSKSCELEHCKAKTEEEAEFTHRQCAFRACFFSIPPCEGSAAGPTRN